MMSPLTTRQPWPPGSHAAMAKIKVESGRWNKSLATLRIEHESARQRDGGKEGDPAKKNDLEAEWL